MKVSLWRRLNTPRDHRWVRARASDYLAGELGQRQERRLTAHSELCPECAHMLRTLEALIAALPALRMAPETTFAIAERTADEVRARLAEWER